MEAFAVDSLTPVLPFSVKEDKIPEPTVVTPSNRFISVAVAVTPSRIFNSVAVEVTPSKIFNSVAVDAVSYTHLTLPTSG